MSLELSSRRGRAPFCLLCAARLLHNTSNHTRYHTTTQHTTPAAIVQCLPADDGRFEHREHTEHREHREDREHREEFSHTPRRGLRSISRLFIAICCGLWARHPSPTAAAILFYRNTSYTPAGEIQIVHVGTPFLRSPRFSIDHPLRAVLSTHLFGEKLAKLPILWKLLLAKLAKKTCQKYVCFCFKKIYISTSLPWQICGRWNFLFHVAICNQSRQHRAKHTNRTPASQTCTNCSNTGMYRGLEGDADSGWCC